MRKQMGFYGVNKWVCKCNLRRKIKRVEWEDWVNRYGFKANEKTDAILRCKVKRVQWVCKCNFKA